GVGGARRYPGAEAPHRASAAQARYRPRTAPRGQARVCRESAEPYRRNRLISPGAIATLKRRLQRETAGSVLFEAAARGRYSTDASIYQILPVGVFVPA